MLSPLVMPGLVPGIHGLLGAGSQDVDGRDKPGQDVEDQSITRLNQIWRSTSFSLRLAIASEGFSPFGQAFAQFMMVWQR